MKTLWNNFTAWLHRVTAPAPTVQQCEVTGRPVFFEYLSPKNAPVIEGLEQYEIVYAKDQPEYIPLRTLPSNDRERRVLSRWDLTTEQRQAVANGADVFLQLKTFGGPLQPIMIAVGDKPNVDYFRHTFNLAERRPFPRPDVN